MTDKADQMLANTTHAVAAASVTSPAWLPSLHEMSQFAATVMPILGAIWLIVQIIRAVAQWYRP